MLIEKVRAIEQSLKAWRFIILILTIGMLVVSILANNQLVVVALINSLYALALFKMKTLPVASYQLFILLQFAYLIYLFGKLLEAFYSNPATALANTLKRFFYMITLILFMIVLWRHYQKQQLIDSLNVVDEDEQSNV